MAEYYLWFKVGHIISFVAWFAGQFYIWRLFVYHAETDSAEVKKTLAVMESKLLRIIMRPASVLTLIFGLALFHANGAALLASKWIWVKLVIVVLLYGHHGLAEVFRKKLERGEVIPGKKFRILNEVPTLYLIIIVILAVLKPNLG